MDQKAAFLASEGDAWKLRNATVRRLENDPVLNGLSALRYRPKTVLEVGCGDGWRLREIALEHGAQCTGIDPSEPSPSDASVTLMRGTADNLPMQDASVDLLIFGFCLYLTDPKDHFRIVTEADRVLADRGLMVIYDFAPGRAYSNPYSHFEGLLSRKMDYAGLFLAHPSYRRLHRAYAEHGDDRSYAADDAVAADFLIKDTFAAFPLRDQVVFPTTSR